jgi:hypothetical protein
MKTSQLPLYHVNLKKWEAARRARGLPCDTAALDALKMRTIGRVCSSKQFTQKELDAMLAAFLAADEPANYHGQIALQEQPEVRKAMAIRRIGCLMYHLQITAGREGHYVAGIARNLFGTEQYQNLDDVKVAQLEGVIVRRLLQLHSKDRVEELQNAAAEEAARVPALMAANAANLANLSGKRQPGDPF